MWARARSCLRSALSLRRDYRDLRRGKRSFRPLHNGGFSFPQWVVLLRYVDSVPIFVLLVGFYFIPLFSLGCEVANFEFLFLDVLPVFGIVRAPKYDLRGL